MSSLKHDRSASLAGGPAGHPDGRGTQVRSRLLRTFGDLTSRVHLRHQWLTVETIGHVVTQRCATCRRTRVRIR
ncbi:hypothetical protein Sme01_02320 [Sphaerisporangium melleum]|uniref:Uncharacterized protein n=1 Tax=Sphaerisporangium melleum TaxID=321316 RepID=A0A917VK34_9ACTN|nr:hypothetical protein [Sphaerisporangium melleum]GGK89025.1 hypothetical protein GCM10007964_34650 [Sphaerisporangium melleum]GII67756.1 hypothetical protein Sme01_02320 [Sphaerisporangium melleum]